MMWFPQISVQYVPRWVLDCAQVAHSDEAMLAITAVFIWHFYNVHFSPLVFPMSMVWLNGKFSQEEMEEFHPLELQKIAPAEAGSGEQTVEVSTFRRNPGLIIAQMIIYAAILAWFLYGFLPLGLM